jgi:type IV secretion system protein VirB2
MRVRPTPRTLATVGLAAVLTLVVVSPALAQSTGAGGNIGTFIQNVINLLNNNIIRGLAIIAIIITGIAWMFGHVDLRRAGTVIIGIIVIFGAATIVDLITGGSFGTGG